MAPCPVWAWHTHVRPVERGRAELGEQWRAGLGVPAPPRREYPYRVISKRSSLENLSQCRVLSGIWNSGLTEIQKFSRKSQSIQKF
eukprot:COSAG01_NODE_2137_length_8329_cov_52.487242_3_plen_86_part_00